MDITPQDNTQQPISDDQELAKALAGVVPGVEQPAAAATPAPAADDSKIDFEETPAPAAADKHSDDLPELPAAPVTSSNPELDGIKKAALQELRPLIDKVDLPADEKFTIYLMLIRSTDDSTLIGPAHEVALKIEDEEARAKALLDIIKEIDYFSQEAQKAA